MQSQITPLLAAAHEGHVEVVRVLVEAGAKLNEADQVQCVDI